MIVKIDIDGVIRDLVSAMCELYNRDFNESITSEDVTEYDVTSFFPKIQNPQKYFFEDNSLFVFLSHATIFEGVNAAMMKLHNAGHKIVIVSYQPTYSNKRHTLNFLENNGVYYDDICFTHDKDIICGDILIDDNPEFINQCCNETTYLIERPYTRNKEVKCNRRFDSLLDCVNFILGE